MVLSIWTTCLATSKPRLNELCGSNIQQINTAVDWSKEITEGMIANVRYFISSGNPQFIFVLNVEDK